MARTAEQLIESGVAIPDDPVEIARLLESAEEPTKPAAEAPAAKPEEPAAAAAAGEPAAAPETEPPAAAEEPEEKGPPRALLRGYRERLHATEAENDALEQRAQAAERALEALQAKLAAGQETLQQQADTLDTGAVLATLTPEKLAELRKTHDDEIVDALETLAKANETLQEQVQAVNADKDELIEAAERARTRELIDNLDSVPLLGVIRVSKDPKADAYWERAVAYKDAIIADPDFIGRGPREVFAEVARRMEGFLGADVVKTLLAEAPAQTKPAGGKPAAAAPAGGKSPEQVVSEALTKARKAAVPTSLSEIPAAGGAVAQDSLERVEAMSYQDMDKLMSDWMAAGKKPDDLIARLLSAAPP